MKFLTTALIATLSSVALADILPDVHGAPSAAYVKESLRPPEGNNAYDVLYAKGNRVYQCNPERTGFQHWYNVQTHAFLYPTKERKEPFDLPGLEIGQVAMAPLNGTQADPLDPVPVMTYYPDGSWVGTTRPLKTTTLEEGRAERGDAGNLDDHLEPVVYTSDDGYFSHAKYIVRLGSLDGVRPAAEDCTYKGKLVNKPFTAFFLLYTNQEGEENLVKEKEAWDQLVEEYKIADPVAH
ncbi:hypothetical protein BDB00DRAFT_983480 [Zychaea mexicana]|uniref:uncharacterized protein n=1 Tax=Zychaea mexicana TaxID=64656 RepID=UPI0022FEA421|nr:uncharacterized protein BDB00DRAFT_983480 [Zychaea mexicana]KAI9484964.1 hypothetical protein BDB00DRAFT_983480 [Zychaea mexicana]